MLQGIQTVGSLLINTKEGACMLGISYDHMRKMIRKNKIPHVQIGRLVKLRRKDVEAFVASNGTQEMENEYVTNQEAKTG